MNARMVAADVETPSGAEFPVSQEVAVSIHNVNGTIAVDTWDRPYVRVVYAKRAKRPADLHGVHVGCHNSGDIIEIGASFAQYTLLNTVTTVDFNVTVPNRASRLTIESTNSDVRVQGVALGAEIAVSNGKIAFGRLEKSSHLRTVNGDIDVNVGRLEPNSTLDISTTNGNCRARFAADSDAFISAHSGTGSVTNAFQESGNTKSSGRGITHVGAGRNAVTLVTVNGDVVIEPLR